MSWIPAPLVPPGDNTTPVTVCLTAAEAERLERVLTYCLDNNGLDALTVCDAIFLHGLRMAEAKILQNTLTY